MYRAHITKNRGCSVLNVVGTHNYTNSDIYKRCFASDWFRVLKVSEQCISSVSYALPPAALRRSERNCRRKSRNNIDILLYVFINIYLEVAKN